MILPIIIYPNPLLRQVCEPVADPTSVKDLIQHMVETMLNAKGLGLSAPQVGITKRVFVCADKVLINPQIIECYGEQHEEEGCLSFPSINIKIKRPQKIIVSALDINFDTKTYEETDLTARIFSHEIDHLNGVLFIDYLGSVRRSMLLKKFRKYKKLIKVNHG
jgi:peptide deformylase